MRRQLLRGFVRIGWHLGGMSWNEYLSLTWTQRYQLHDELTEIIDRSEGSPPPRDMR